MHYKHCGNGRGRRMKKRIKTALKKIPVVKKYVEYRNYGKQYNAAQKELADVNIELEKVTQELRKTCLDVVLQQNSERNHTRKYMKQCVSRYGLEAMRDVFSESIINELYYDGNPLVSIIILNRNGVDKLTDLMESFKKSDFYENFEIIFVDNASTDQSVKYMEKWKDTYNIQIICNNENRSFSAANNQAAEVAKGEYLLFLNNDVAVTDGWLDELLLAYQKSECPGALGARLVYPDVLGDNQAKEKAYAVQHRGIAFKDSKRQKQYFIRPYNMNMGDMVCSEDVEIQERAAVTAAALMVDKVAFETVGGFSEAYFYGFEDVDLGLKLHKKGYKNYYCPRSIIYHYEFGTRDKGDTPEAKKRGNHNVAVFQGRWQKYLSKRMLLDKLKGEGLFTEQPLQIAIAYNREEKEENLTILEKRFEKSGYKVIYLDFKNAKKYYDLTPNTDVLIVLDPDYDISKISNKKNDLLTIRMLTDDAKDKNNQYYCNIDINELLQNQQLFFNIVEDFSTDKVDKKMIDICGCMPNNETMKFWGDLHFAKAMKKEFEKKGYSANILTRDEWYNRSNAKYTIFLRGNREYYPTIEDGRVAIMWNISHPDEVSLHEYNSFDYIFFASDKLKDRIGEKLQCESGVLMQCADEQVMCAEETSAKKYELLFVGNSRHVYRQILKDLLPTKYRLTVIGRHWEEYPVQQYVVQDYISNDEVGQAYHDAQILLNDHWDDMKEQGIISNRIYDALSAGAFVISDYMPEINEVFKGAVVTYKDREDLSQKIDYYMEHEEERLEKVKLGQEIVWKEHTFRNRVEKIIDVMEKL